MNFHVFPGFPTRLRIRNMNVKYSPNLGDGLLSECLEAAMLDTGLVTDAVSIDLAGRQGYGAACTGRSAALALLNRLPKVLRGLAVRPLLALKSRRSWGPHYSEGLAIADAMVIGGGNLLTDHDLNFPTKLALALRRAASQNVPSAIFAAGMGAGWSREGLRRMRKALRANPPKAVFMRDHASKERWDETFGRDLGRKATVVRDPGLLASEVWPRWTAPFGTGPQIGLGIISGEAVRYHSDAQIGNRALGDWYVALAEALTRAGARVVTFTNGAPEDVAFAQSLAPRLEALGGQHRHVNPGTPAQLAGLVSSCNAIAAYRMHAIIAAYSYGVPGLALKWDDKLDAFMASVGRSAFLRDPEVLAPQAAAAILMRAALEGVDEKTRRRVLFEARRDVTLLLGALGSGHVTPVEMPFDEMPFVESPFDEMPPAAVAAA